MSEFGERKPVSPISLLMVDINAKILFNCHIKLFCLTISLRMIGGGRISLSLRRPVMKDETNCGPRSDMIFQGVPWSLKMWSRYILATLRAVIVDETGNIWTIFKKVSMTMRMTSFPCDVRRGPMMSTEIISQRHSAILFGCNCVFFYFVFTF